MSRTLPQIVHELAGMVDPSGVLGRTSLPTGGPTAYEIVNIDKRLGILYWKEPDATKGIEQLVRESNRLTRQVKSDGMLDAFIRITTPEHVLSFAKKFGPLRLCKHGHPASHRPASFVDKASPPDPESFCRPESYKGVYHEPLSRWFEYSAQARAILDIGARLWQEEPRPREFWATALGDNQSKLLPFVGEDIGTDKLALSILIQYWWLRDAGIQLSWAWTRTTPTPSLYFSLDTFGAITLQMMVALGRAHSIAICDGCQTPYERNRAPAKKRKNFCGALECKRIGNKLRVARHKSKRRETGNVEES